MGEAAGDIRHDIERTRTRMTATLEAISYKMDIPARVRYRFSHIAHDVGDAFTGKPDGGDGGEAGLLTAGEERISAMLHTAQSQISGAVGAAGGRLSGATQRVQTGLNEIKESVVDTLTTARDAGKTDAMTSVEAAKDETMEAAQPAPDGARSTWKTIGAFAKDNALAISLGAFAAGAVAGTFIFRTRGKDEGFAPIAKQIRHRAVGTGEKVLHRGQKMAKETVASIAGRR